MLGGSVPAGQPLEIEGASQPGLVTKNGLVLYGTDGKPVSVSVVDKYSEQTKVELSYCYSPDTVEFMAAEFMQTQRVLACLSWPRSCTLSTLCLGHSCW